MNGEPYYCCTCGWFGNDPAERHEREPFEFWGERGMHETVLAMCPKCGSEDIEEAFPCYDCSEAPATHEDYCQSCYTRLAASGEFAL